jgi:cytochrome c2
MRVRLSVATLLLAAGLLSAAAAVAVAAQDHGEVLIPGNALDGSRLFSSKGCLSCHAVYGVGGTTGPDLGRGMRNRPLLEIAAVMWNHAPGMEHVFQEKRVTRPTLEPPEMASLLAYLYYLGSLDAPGDAAAGGRLFREKGCEQCHAIGGAGGHVGPPLDRYSRYASPLFLTSALWQHGRAMSATMQARSVARPTFQGNDIPDLLAYIRTASTTTERVYAVPGSPKRGEELFDAKRCSTCHALRGHGIGPDLALTLHGSLTQIAGAMWNHGPRMWAKMAERNIAVPSITTDEMSDLVSYLYFFQFIDAPGNAANGAVVFREKRCATCHESSAPSKHAGPALSVLADMLRTPLGVITAMWNHAGKMKEVMTEENVAWPLLKGREMADLMAYLLKDRVHPTIPDNPGRARAHAGRR